MRGFILLDPSRPFLCGGGLGVIARDVAALKHNRRAKQFLAHQGGAFSPLVCQGSPREAPCLATRLSLPNSLFPSPGILGKSFFVPFRLILLKLGQPVFGPGCRMRGFWSLVGTSHIFELEDGGYVLQVAC